MLSHQMENAVTDLRKPIVDSFQTQPQSQPKADRRKVSRPADPMGILFDNYWQELWQQPSQIGDQLDQIA